MEDLTVCRGQAIAITIPTPSRHSSAIRRSERHSHLDFELNVRCPVKLEIKDNSKKGANSLTMARTLSETTLGQYTLIGNSMKRT